MSTAVESQARFLQGERRFLLHDVGWAGYESLLAMIGDGATRVTYCDGDAELMSPLPDHEYRKTLLGFVVEAIAEELDLWLNSAGSTTFGRRDLDKGLEPDECYYLDRARRDAWVGSDPPPPDLAVEVEMTTSALPRMKIYAALGVREVWRFDGESLTVHVRRPDATYEARSSSEFFPSLPIEEVGRRIEQADRNAEIAWRREFRGWIRAGFPTHPEDDRPPGA